MGGPDPSQARVQRDRPSRCSVQSRCQRSPGLEMCVTAAGDAVWEARRLPPPIRMGDALKDGVLVGLGCSWTLREDRVCLSFTGTFGCTLNSSILFFLGGSEGGVSQPGWVQALSSDSGSSAAPTVEPFPPGPERAVLAYGRGLLQVGGGKLSAVQTYLQEVSYFRSVLFYLVPCAKVVQFQVREFHVVLSAGWTPQTANQCTLASLKVC